MVDLNFNFNTDPNRLRELSKPLGEIDLEECERLVNDCLFVDCEVGGFLLEPRDFNSYEVHTLPDPKFKKYAIRMTRQGLAWFFKNTDTVEIYTKIPTDNTQAIKLAEASWMRYQYTLNNAYKGKECLFYVISLQDWINNDKSLLKSGEEFHNAVEPDHGKEDGHDLYVGAAIEMVKVGMVAKGITTYNKWADIAGYEEVELVSVDPLVVDIRTHLIKWDGLNMEVEKCH